MAASRCDGMIDCVGYLYCFATQEYVKNVKDGERHYMCPLRLEHDNARIARGVM